MQKKEIYVFLFDGYSDWEIAYLAPEINKNEQFKLVYFSENGNMVMSMGGLQVQPTKSLEQLKIENIDLLILPGGTTWEQGKNNIIEELTKQMFETGKPIAAICGATAFLGQLGLLNNLKHTSNDLYYLKYVAPQYCGDEHYLNKLAVSDNNMITAKGIAPIEFAREVFKMIDLYDDKALEKWFQLFKNGIWEQIKSKEYSHSATLSDTETGHKYQQMKIHHIAIWANELEKLKDFYVNYFGMRCSDKYENKVNQYSSYFLSFKNNGTRIELMHRPDIASPHNLKAKTFGLTHFSISVASKEKVNLLTEQLRTDGYKIVGEPRTTGDGYYESVIEDCEGNWVEITE